MQRPSAFLALIHELIHSFQCLSLSPMASSASDRAGQEREVPHPSPGAKRQGNIENQNSRKLRNSQELLAALGHRCIARPKVLKWRQQFSPKESSIPYGSSQNENNG